MTVCPPAWHRWCIGGLCGCCIVCTGIGQINGNAAVKLRKRFWRFGRIICINGRMTAVNACKRLTRRLAKRKALHRVDARQKKNPASVGWGGVALRCSPAKVSGRRHFDALNNAAKNQKKNSIQDNITCRTPLYHAETLVGGLAAALCVYIRVQRLEQLAI